MFTYRLHRDMHTNRRTNQAELIDLVQAIVQQELKKPIKGIK